MKIRTRPIFSKISVFLMFVTARLRNIAARWLIPGTIGICVSLGLAACAMAPTAAPDIKKLVAERATARWQALIKGDLDTAYGFLSPGSRATVSMELYKAKIKNNFWRGVEVQSVECAEQVCKVTVQVTYDYRRMKGIKAEVSESWLLAEGNAWLVYSE